MLNGVTMTATRLAAALCVWHGCLCFSGPIVLDKRRYCKCQKREKMNAKMGRDVH